jgi:hypothetical protein
MFGQFGCGPLFAQKHWDLSKSLDYEGLNFFYEIGNLTTALAPGLLSCVPVK